jgi:hypothetical protein
MLNLNKDKNSTAKGSIREYFSFMSKLEIILWIVLICYNLTWWVKIPLVLDIIVQAVIFLIMTGLTDFLLPYKSRRLLKCGQRWTKRN